MKKGVCSLLIALSYVLMLTACVQMNGMESSAWQEQYDLGVRYLSEGNYEEAIIAFTAAIEIDPNQAVAYVGRGDTYVALGGQEHLLSAQTDYEIALKIDNQLIDIFDKLFSIHMDMDNPEAAMEVLQTKYFVTKDERIIEELINLSDSYSIHPEQFIFTQEVIPPEEWTINGVPCWEATPDDMRKVLDGYDVVDVNVGPNGQPDPWTDHIGIAVIATPDCFTWMIDSNRMINADYGTMLTECRGISPGISTEECLQKLGVSEIGIRYFQSRWTEMEEEPVFSGKDFYDYYIDENTQCTLQFFTPSQLELHYHEKDYFKKDDGFGLCIRFSFEQETLKLIAYRPSVNGHFYG